MFWNQASTTATLNGDETRDYGDADLRADMADIDDFAFWNDVRRCEMLLSALNSSFEICKENMNAEVVAKMAEELEKVVSVVNQMS
jgi:hypothetical protein